MDWDRLQTNIAWRWLNCCDVNVVMNMLISLWLFWFEYQLVKQFQLARYATRLVAPCSMSFFGRPDEGCNVTCDFTLRDVFVETWCSSLLGEFRYLSEKWMCSNRCVCWAKRHQKATFQGKKETTNAKNTSNICQYSHWIAIQKLDFFGVLAFGHILRGLCRADQIEISRRHDWTATVGRRSGGDDFWCGSMGSSKKNRFFQVWNHVVMFTKDWHLRFFFHGQQKHMKKNNNWRIRKLAVIPTKVSETFRPKNHFSL